MTLTGVLAQYPSGIVVRLEFSHLDITNCFQVKTPQDLKNYHIKIIETNECEVVLYHVKTQRQDIERGCHCSVSLNQDR